MDTTYCGRRFWLMVIKGTFRSKILWCKFVRHETIADYLEGMRWLEDHVFTIHAIVCDDIRGLFHAQPRYLVQMCQLHQMMIARRYLTNSPELTASQQLLDMAKTMFHTGKDTFMDELDSLHGRWKGSLGERTVGKDGKRSTYTQKRMRGAYLSLKRSMPCLWTFQEYPHLPNTSNAIEGVFTDIKTKLRVQSRHH